MDKGREGWTDKQFWSVGPSVYNSDVWISAIAQANLRQIRERMEFSPPTFLHFVPPKPQHPQGWLSNAIASHDLTKIQQHPNERLQSTRSEKSCYPIS
jgi:hypothetical protein